MKGSYNSTSHHHRKKNMLYSVSIFLLTLLFRLSTASTSNEEFHKLDYNEEKYSNNKKGITKSRTMDDIATRMNNFCFKFHEIISKDTAGNIIFSPFSIYTALAMVGVGTEGKTKEEIAVALSWDSDDLIPLLNKLQPLYSNLTKGGNGASLDIANKAWVGEGSEILKTYQDRIMGYFHVEMGKEDFAGDPESARQDINDWVAKKTGQNIKELFSSGSIQKMTQLVLANAVYFKGEWKNKFDANDTFKDKFYITMSEEVEVEFMFRHDSISMAVDNENKVQLLELPYAGEVFSIIFVIPFAEEDHMGGIKSFGNLAEIEDGIKDKTKTLNGWIEKLPDHPSSEIDVFVPKFEMKLSIDLITQLQKLGINDLFVEGKADLSGINGKTDLYINSAVHQAFIKVDEEGTEAAAATGFAANSYSMPAEVYLNHPFLFYIIHKSSSTVIFSGKVQNPLA